MVFPTFPDATGEIEPQRSFSVTQHGFYARPRLPSLEHVWFAVFDRSVVACWFAMPWTAVDTASLATWFLFDKLFGLTTLVGFGEKRCRKNLPLAAPIRAVTSKNHQCPECHGHDVIALVYKNRKLRTMFSDDWNATVGRRIVTDNAEFAKNKDGSPKHRGDAKYRCRTCNHEW